MPNRINTSSIDPPQRAEKLEIADFVKIAVSLS